MPNFKDMRIINPPAGYGDKSVFLIFIGLTLDGQVWKREVYSYEGEIRYSDWKEDHHTEWNPKSFYEPQDKDGVR